jgi:signal transduction histidine kinase/ActR/RegA family two-component response regulator
MARWKNLHRASLLLSGEGPLGETLPELTALVVQAAGVEAGALFLHPEAAQGLAAVFHCNLPRLGAGVPGVGGERALDAGALASELLLSLALDRGEPRLYNDYPGYVLAHPGLLSAGVVHLAAAPLSGGERTFGVLALMDCSGRRPFSAADVPFLQTAARLLALRLEVEHHARLARRSQEGIEAVQWASADLTVSLELPKVLDSILATAATLVPVDLGHVFLYGDDTLSFGAALGSEGRMERPFAEPRPEGLTYRVARSGVPLVVQNIRRHPLYAGSPSGWTGSIVAHPLKVKGRVVGVMSMSRMRPRPFEEQEQRVLEMLAAQAAIAIENARLHQSVRDQLRALQESQARLVQSEKMAAVGRLVAGVAHELNNPLTAIIGISQLTQSLLESGESGERLRDDLQRLVAEAHRAGRIVRSLLDFSRQKPSERRPVQVNEVLTGTLEILAHDLESRNVRWQLNLADELPATMADAHQLQQVFVNLITNAAEAMQETGGGALHLSSALVVSPLGPEEGRFVRVIVRDTGPGIEASLCSQVFDPFFTTKPAGKGTGLGLAVCHGIVGEHGGQIWVESTPGQGAAFYVQIPVMAPPAPEPDRPPASQPPAAERGPDAPGAPGTGQAGAHRVLVVEDEAVVRELVARLLREQGLPVDTCGDGEQALALLRGGRGGSGGPPGSHDPTRGPSGYSLVVCDVRLPGRSGIDLYQALRDDEGPRVPFVFITGDTLSAETVGLLGSLGVPYLNKPFEIEELVALVRKEISR